MNLNSSLQDLLDKGEFDLIVSIISSSENLENLKLNYFLRKIFQHYQSKLQFEVISDILMILAKYRNSICKNEMNEGLKLLLNHQ